MIGQMIAQYKILEKIGEGGMGVVYKAQDTKLDRIVALKFLPHHLTVHDAERARFLQEARAASALNHPNVCVIHDLQEYNGEHFIVMEFVEGVTLREKISIAARGKDRYLPMDTVIAYATQIGEALQEAHGKGIVHRDVKAENMMVTPRNQIKVMDFGLAKLKGSLKITKTSSTVGTLAYMAPEQLQGGDVDARSDIFSFGVVLYEMLTGGTPFRGEHEAAMMYSILNEEPEPVEKFRPGLPSELLHLLHRALEKNPEDRYQSIGEMVIDLRRLKKQSTKVTRPIELPKASAGAASQEAPEQIAALKPNRKRIIAIGAAGLVIVVAFAWYMIHNAGSSGLTGKLNPNMKFRVLQIPFTQIYYPGLSQDGNWAAFPAVGADGKWDIYFMNVLGGEPRRITSDSALAMNAADISPDGSRITYDRFVSNSGLVEAAVISSLGGVSKRIAANGECPRWTPNGERIGYIVLGFGATNPSGSGKQEFWSVKADGSDARREFIDSLSVRGRFSFSWSPDGQSIAWIRSFPEAYQEVITRELATGKERQLTFDKKNVDEVCWTKQGEIIYSSNKNGNMNLWMVPASGGDAVQITKGSGPDFGVKISADGTKLLFYQFQPVQNIWIAGIDGANAHPITFEDRRMEAPMFSPDGKQIAFSLYDPDAAKLNRSIVVMDRNGSNRREITSGAGVAEWPQWSPDGRWIAFITHGASESHELSARVAIVDPVNPAAPRVLAKGVAYRWVDEKTLAISTQDHSSLVPIDGTSPAPLSDDSTVQIPLQHLKYGLVFPSHFPFQDLKLVPLKDRHPERNHMITLYRGLWGGITFGPDDSYIMLFTAKSEVLKIIVPGGRVQDLTGRFPGMDPANLLTISSNGREVVYNDAKQNGKLVMIENMR